MNRKLRVLVGCEFSGVVRRAFRALGHNAWSCDLLPAEDGSPFHIQDDVLKHLDEGWDLGIFHPDCTYLCASGMHWTTRGKRPQQLTEDALNFVRALLAAPIPHIALENPVGTISTRIRKPDCKVQPYDFGDDASKNTCLWLKDLPPLEPTQHIPPRLVCKCGVTYKGNEHRCCPSCWAAVAESKPRWSNQTDSGQNKLGPSEKRGLERARTYAGIASAIASQWSAYILNKTT